MTVLAATQTFDSLPAIYYHQDRSGIIHFESTGYPLFKHPFYSDDKLKSWLENKDSLVYHFSDESHLNKLGPGWAWDDRLILFLRNPFSIPSLWKCSKRDNDPKIKFGRVSRIIFHVQKSLFYQNPLFRDLSENRFYINHNRLIPGDTVFVPFITSEKLTAEILEKALGKIYW